MFSKGLELAGLGMIAYGVAVLLGAAAGLICGGVSLLFVGGVTDDAAVGLAVRRATGWVRYAFYRQMARENGVPVPDLRPLGARDGWARCDCGGEDECPVCGGSGVVPDPEHHANPRSPHPPIKVNPQAEEFWGRKARARNERAKVRDRTPALTRPEQDHLERLA